METHQVPKYPGHLDQNTPFTAQSEVNNPRYKFVTQNQPLQTFEDIETTDVASQVVSSYFCSFCNGSGAPCSFCGAYMDLQAQPPVQRVKVNEMYEDRSAPKQKTIMVDYEQLIQEEKGTNKQVLNTPVKIYAPLQRSLYEKDNIKECRSSASINGGKVVQIISQPQDIVNPNVDVVIITSSAPSTFHLPVLDGKDVLSSGSNIVNIKDIVIKNYSLASHTLKANDSNKIDKVMTTIKLEPGAKKQLLATGSNWINV